MGLERLMLIMEKQGLPFPEKEKCVLYLASMGEKALVEASKIATTLRHEGVHAEFDVVGRSVKAQMKYANKIGAAFTCVIGDSELESGVLKVKNMADGEEAEVALNSFEADFMNIYLSESLKEFEEMGLGENLDLSTLLGSNNG